jgi:hydrogenase maturation protease
MSTSPRILIAGVGNIFLRDDAFGVEVVRQLLRRRTCKNVDVVDFGIRGLDLAYAILDEQYEIVILIGAVQRGGAAGSLYVIEPDVRARREGTSDIDSPEAVNRTLDTHNMDPVRVFRLVQAMGGNIKRIIMLGCEPSPADKFPDMTERLSAPVRGAIDQAASMAETIVDELLADNTQRSIISDRFGKQPSVRRAAKKGRAGAASAPIITLLASLLIGAGAGFVASHQTSTPWIGIVVGVAAMFLVWIIGGVACCDPDMGHCISIKRS